MRRATISLIAALLPVRVFGGEIAGMPVSLPPFVDSPFQVSLSNDFLGRGGSVDDFRTQQFIFDGDVGDRWRAVLDYSVLTLSGLPGPGRIDQLAASLGYRWIDRSAIDASLQFTTGFGIRSYDDWSGEQVQNGFHRLIGSDVENLPYTGESGVSATLWLDATRTRSVITTADGWDLGYRVNGRALVTSDGEFDSALSLLGTAARGSFGAWAGLRQDWRSGYEGIVQRATAAAEEDLALTLGVRFGSLILETVQQFNDDASYGLLRLISSETASRRSDSAAPRYAIEFGFLLPDVHLHLAGRMQTAILAAAGSAWRESLVISIDTGEPQQGNDASIYLDAQQFGAALEWERMLTPESGWLGVYGSLGAGWREERLIGDGPLVGVSSRSADSPVLLASAGMRLHASAFSANAAYRIQLGLNGWLPTDAATRAIAGAPLAVLQPGLALALGVSFEFR